MPCDKCDNKPSSSPLTTVRSVGTIKGGSEAKPSDQKNRRPKGATLNSLADFILRLHTWARDWSDQDTASELTAAMYDLAVVLKEEYDQRHGK